MADYKGHMVGAFVAVGAFMAAAAFVGYRLKPIFFLQALFFAFLGALFPDIDTKSKGQRLLYMILFCLLLILLVYKKFLIAAVIALMSFVPLLVHHRGFLHTVWFSVFFTTVSVVICSLQCPAYAAAAVRNGLFFLVGIFSHLLIDFGPRRFFSKRS